MLQTILGLRADAPRKRLSVNPTLPEWLSDLQLQHLRVGPCMFTLHFWREGDRSRWEVVERRADQGVTQEDLIQAIDERESGSAHRQDTSIATSRVAMISPPSMPRTAQPRICCVSASTTALIKPRVSSTSSARAT